MENFLYRIVCLVFCLGASVAAADLEIIQSSNESFAGRLTVATDLSNLSTVKTADSSIWYYRDITLIVPPGATPELVSAAGSDLPSLRRDYRATEATAAVPLATIGSMVATRGRRMVTVRISPVAGDRVFPTVDFTVRFIGAARSIGRPVNDPHFDRILSASAANWDAARLWGGMKPFASSTSAVQSELENGSDWLVLRTDRSGLCRVTGSQLEAAGLSLVGLNSSDIRMFNGGGRQLPIDNQPELPDMREVAIIIEDGGDNQFNANDAIIFYAEALDRYAWLGSFALSYVNNPYESLNAYWLTTSYTGTTPPVRMPSINGAPSGSATLNITNFERIVRLEQENLLKRETDGHIDNYLDWHWTSDSLVTLSTATPGIMLGESATVFVNAATYSPYVTLNVNGISADKGTCNRLNCKFTTASLTDGLNVLDIKVHPSNSGNLPFLNFVEIAYPSELLPVNNVLDLYVPQQDGLANIDVVDNFSSNPLVLDISDPMRPMRISNATRSAGLLRFSSQIEPDTSNQFYIAPVSTAFGPVSIEQPQLAGLRTGLPQSDLIIVTDERFTDALDEYTSWRQSEGYSITVVTVADIMTEFGFGLYDPTAIRDFLRFAWENLPEPSPYAVLLVGDGSYDYLDYLGTGTRNYVPPFILNRGAVVPVADDNFVYFGDYGILDSDTSLVNGDGGLDMMIARWPVRSSAEVATIVARAKAYASPATFGTWRTDITLVADDEFARRNGTVVNYETFHVIETQRLDSNYIPSLLTREKIYLWDYPNVNEKKPAVNDAIVRALNDGTLLINYVGHGNPEQWAHEAVFLRSSDLPRLTNNSKLPLFFAASCAIGFFDDPEREGMGEDLMILPNGGAIGVLSASRLVYAQENADFNKAVFDVLLYNDSLSMCEAIYAAKVARQYNGTNTPRPEANDQQYHFFGDPLLRLGLPEHVVEFTTFPDSLRALEPTTVAGRVLNTDSTTLVQDGTLSIVVYDTDRQMTHRPANATNPTRDIKYQMTGAQIFRGTATISNGEFSFDFIPPLDLGYGGEGARVVVYGNLGSVDAAGSVDSLAVSDSVVVPTDSAGPSIAYNFAGNPTFEPGGRISSGDMLEIELTDQSGINLAGGLGQGITLEIDGDVEAVQNLTSLFEYDPNTYTVGRLHYALAELAPGEHTFKIKAWDNANNASIATFTADVGPTGPAAIVNLLNYPNPMADSTRFSFELTDNVSHLSLDIFTVAGRKIQSFSRSGLQPQYYDDIVWYGQDYSGRRVATGVYIYKASARTSDGKAIESFGKVVVVN